MSMQSLSQRSANSGERSCCLCESTDFEIVGTLDRNRSPLVTVMCSHCGLISHRDIPTDAELTAFYESRYRLEYHGERRPAARRVMRAWKNGVRILRQLSPHIPQGARVLEIGAGLGCTVKNFQDAGFDAAGVDPGIDFTQFSVSELGANMSQQALMDVSGPPRDAILLIHVIEHLNVPDESLLRIRQLLAADGLLYVECPNLDAPVARRSQLFHFAHIYSFTPATLQMLAERCGFELVSRFGGRSDANLQMLFRRSDSRRFTITPDARRRTLARIRMGAVRYHVRPAYLMDRLVKLLGYLSEKVFAERFVERLIARCQRTQPAQERTDESAATILPLRGRPESVTRSANRRVA